MNSDQSNEAGASDRGSDVSVRDRSVAVTAQPDYQLQFERSAHRISTGYDGVTVADSDEVIILREPRYQPVYYFPRRHVRMELLQPTEHLTHCPFKGNACYWNLCVNDKVEENIAWSYPQPLAEAQPIAGYIAFYRDRMRGWSENGSQMSSHSLHQPTGHVNSLVNWLLWEAWDAATPQELLARLVQQLNELGAGLMHVNVVIPTLHPLLAARAYRWTRAAADVEAFGATHQTLSSSAFQDSPLVPVLEGLGGIRVHISDNAAVGQYPIIDELRIAGATDYVALPMSFSDGQINVITLATERADGFALDVLAQIHEILPLLGRLFEVHAMKHTAATLLQTFIGKHTGAQVLNGAIKRGDGEDIHAVIWFSDLRDSTELAERMSRQAFLEYLNRYFDCVAGAVAGQGGEVLRFIGDAMLAIFPIANDQQGDRDTFASAADACSAAIRAAEVVRSDLQEANKDAVSQGREPVRLGIGLHLGDVIYGNIGSEDRLEFTVVGAAANEAARIENMSKELGCPVVISSVFARAAGMGFLDLGEHLLRGVRQPQRLYTLAGAGTDL